MVLKQSESDFFSNVVQTYGGHLFNFEEIESNVIDIKSIAHALSQQCRWSGHTVEFYSVAQHSCHVFDRVLFDTNDMLYAAEGLTHDAPEYVFLDISRPLKKRLPCYTKELKRGERYIMNQLGLPEHMSYEVMVVDNRMLSTEYLQLVDVDHHLRVPTMMEFMKDFPPYEKTELDLLNSLWSCHRAEDEFMKRWKKVDKQRTGSGNVTHLWGGKRWSDLEEI